MFVLYTLLVPFWTPPATPKSPTNVYISSYFNSSGTSRLQKGRPIPTGQPKGLDFKASGTMLDSMLERFRVCFEVCSVKFRIPKRLLKLMLSSLAFARWRLCARSALDIRRPPRSGCHGVLDLVSNPSSLSRSLNSCSRHSPCCQQSLNFTPSSPKIAHSLRKIPQDSPEILQPDLPKVVHRNGQDERKGPAVLAAGVFNTITLYSYDTDIYIYIYTYICEKQ